MCAHRHAWWMKSTGLKESLHRSSRRLLRPGQTKHSRNENLSAVAVASSAAVYFWCTPTEDDHTVTRSSQHHTSILISSIPPAHNRGTIRSLGHCEARVPACAGRCRLPSYPTSDRSRSGKSPLENQAGEASKVGYHPAPRTRSPTKHQHQVSSPALGHSLGHTRKVAKGIGTTGCRKAASFKHTKSADDPAFVCFHGHSLNIAPPSIFAAPPPNTLNHRRFPNG